MKREGKLKVQDLSGYKPAKEGDTVKILTMYSDSSFNGKIGVVNLVDDLGQLYGTWGPAAINPEIDDYFVIARS